MKYPDLVAGIAIAGALPRPKRAVCAAADGPVPGGSQFSVSRARPEASRSCARALFPTRGLSRADLSLPGYSIPHYSQGSVTRAAQGRIFPQFPGGRGPASPPLGF